MDVGGLLGNEAIRARLDAAAAQDRFSHSYLICGPDGSGKHTLAKILAAAMQCTGAGRKPCGRCEGCRKVFEGVHPDVITVNDPAHKTIAVDVIRQMRADVFLRPNEGKRKIYLIEQDMAEPPQNALLKILEEPPAYAAFLILSDRAEKLLPTIRSRCAELHLAPAPQTEGLAFLRGKYPDRAEPELERAFRRAGGYLGQAIQLLSGEGQAPQTAQFAACYAARNALALLELLLPMEKWKREQLIPVLEQLREYLAELLMLLTVLGCWTKRLAKKGTKKSQIMLIWLVVIACVVLTVFMEFRIDRGSMKLLYYSVIALCMTAVCVLALRCRRKAA